MFSSNLRLFQAKDAMFSTKHRVFPTNQSSFQPRTEKSLSNQPLLQTQKGVCLGDQAVVSTTSFAFRHSPKYMHAHRDVAGELDVFDGAGPDLPSILVDHSLERVVGDVARGRPFERHA